MWMLTLSHMQMHVCWRSNWNFILRWYWGPEKRRVYKHSQRLISSSAKQWLQVFLSCCICAKVIFIIQHRQKTLMHIWMFFIAGMTKPQMHARLVGRSHWCTETSLSLVITLSPCDLSHRLAASGSAFHPSQAVCQRAALNHCDEYVKWRH